jgi:hypothetical protein
MQSVMHHYAELDRRKNGTSRLKKLSAMVFDVGTYGTKELENDFYNYYRLLPDEFFSSPEKKTDETKYNHFRGNVNVATKALMNCFVNHENYLRFKTGEL